MLNKLDLWKIYETCDVHYIGYDEMSVILPRIYNLLRDDNQEQIFNLIGDLADKTCCAIDYIVEHVELRYKY